jgi:hypothetical protein
VTGRTWDEAYLDGLRTEADPLADGVVSAYFAEIDGGDPSSLFRTLVTRQSEDAAPGVAEFLRSPYDPPTWVEPYLVAAGQECSRRGWSPTPSVA